MPEAEQQRIELEQVAAAGQEQLSTLRDRRDQAAQDASQHDGAGGHARGAASRRDGRTQRIESLVTEMIERVVALRLQIESAAAEKLQRETENQKLAEQLVDLEAEHNACETRDGLLQVESEQVRARLAEIDQALHQARQLLDQSRDRRAELSATAAKLQSDAQYMAETCLNDLGMQRQELMADATIPIARGEQLTVEDQIYREMRTRLDAMGPVNMMALEEYKETAERHGFLETQRKDLLDSIENTQATIKEIDNFRGRSSKKRSTRSMRISRPHSASFSAAVRASCGSPTRKTAPRAALTWWRRLRERGCRSVLLLSGGEKAMTALALLVGIFQYQPSPFCILDEVDAPLDEANIGRFTELVKEMSVQTQFMLITHSKKTMSIAPGALRRNHAGAGRFQAGVREVRSDGVALSC